VYSGFSNYHVHSRVTEVWLEKKISSFSYERIDAGINEISCQEFLFQNFLVWHTLDKIKGEHNLWLQYNISC
jgi:hypothetical protein